jgi:DNA primase
MTINKQQILNNLDTENFYKSLIPSLKVNSKPEALGLCPFHNDQNPSLSVNIETGLYHCFACGAGGDIFKFYMLIKGVNFKTALTELAKGVRQ